MYKDQIESLRRYVEDCRDLQDLALLNFALDSMMSINAMLSLRVFEVRSENGYIFTSFYHKERRITLSKKTQDLLKEICKMKSQNHYLFTTRKRGNEFPMTPSCYLQRIANWNKKRGLSRKEITSNDIKKARALHVFNETNNIKLVQDMLGQRSPKQTKKYLGIDRDRRVDGMFV